MNTHPFRRPLLLASVFIIQFLAIYDLALMFAIGPTIALRYGISSENIPLLHTGYFMVGIAVPLFGKLSEKLGLLKTVLIGTSFYAAGMIGIAFSENMFLYAAAKLLAGVGYSIILAMMPNFILMIVGDEKATLGSAILKFSFALAFFIAPFSGYKMYVVFGPRLLYVLLSALMIAASILLLVTADSSYPIPRRVKDTSLIRQSRPKTRLLVIMAILSPAPILFVSNFYSIYLSSLEVAGEKISLYYTVMGLGSILSAFFILFASTRFGKRKSTILALAMATVSLVFIMQPAGPLLYLSLFFFYFGFDLFTGLMYVISALKYKQERGVLIPRMAMGVSIGMVGTNYLAKLVYASYGFKANVLLGALCMILCMLIIKHVFFNTKEQEAL